VVSKRILVVDDDPDTTAFLAAYLELQGHEVHCAADGAEAVARSNRCHPHIILLDLSMPLLNGFDAARQIRTLGLNPRPLIVAATGFNRANDRMACEEAGIDVHLVKPVELDVLGQLVEASAFDSST
jgi:CheY-like chemotaxis protein